MKYLIYTLTCLVAAIPSLAESVALTPGALPGYVKEWKLSNPVELQLTGEVTSIDLASLKYLPESVVSLDLSGLTVKGLELRNSKYLGRTEFSDGELPPYALFSTNVREVKLPASLTVIGEAAFAETPLERVDFPSSLRYIGDRAFYLCKSLKIADLTTTSVSTIPEQCFYGCVSLADASFPPVLSSIGNRAFMKSAVTRMNIPGVSEIGEYAFAEMPALVEVTMRNGVKIGEGAFFGDGMLGQMSGMPANSPALAMANNGVRTLTGYIGGEVVDEGAYANLKVDTIVIHPSVREIRNNAFRNATGLKAVDVSERGGDVPVASEDAFAGIDVGKVSLSVAKGDEDAWRNAPVWKDFSITSEGTGIAGVVSDGVRISVTKGAGGIVIKSNVNIDDVAVYSMDGIVLYSAKPDSDTCVAGTFDEKELIVRIVAGGVTKIVKIL